MQEFTSTAKLALRDQLLAGRRRLGLAALGDRARLTAEHLLASTEVRRAATVAAYVLVSTEPGTGPLLEALRAAGKRVILPLLQPDDDLDWAVYDDPRALLTARRGLLEQALQRRSQDAYLAQRWASLRFLGRDFAWDKAQEAKLAALTPEQVSAAFRKAIDPAKLAVFIAADSAKVAAAVKPDTTPDSKPATTGGTP